MNLAFPLLKKGLFKKVVYEKRVHFISKRVVSFVFEAELIKYHSV